MMGFAVIVGAFTVGGNVLSSSPTIPLRLTLGFITGFTVTGASMVINDYWDRDIDRVNEPRKPIPSGAVSPGESMIFAAILSSIGFLSAGLISTLSLAIAVASWMVSVSYNTKGKRTGLLGNFLVSSCVAVPFVYGSVITGEELDLSPIVFAVLAFLSNTGREITKGIVDIRGDETRNIKTIAAVYGEKTAAYVASVFYIAASGLSFLPIHLGLVSSWFLPFVLLADAGFLVSSIILVRTPSRENARRIKNLVLLWMNFALLAFIAGSTIR